jgi:hypothetical protein
MPRRTRSEITGPADEILVAGPDEDIISIVAKRTRVTTETDEEKETTLQRTEKLLGDTTLMQAEVAMAKAIKERDAAAKKGNFGAGTYSARVEAIVAEVCVPSQLVSDIAGGRFKVIDIVRLCGSTGAQIYDETNTVPKLVDGTLAFSQSHAKISDFKGDVWYWNVGFANYVTIWGELFEEKYPKTVTAMVAFSSYMLRQQNKYNANACITYGVARMNGIIQAGVKRASVWKERPANLTEEHFQLSNHKLWSTSSKANRASTNTNNGDKSKTENETCNNFNKTGCTYPRCKRRHECQVCGSTTHGAKDCTKSQK